MTFKECYELGVDFMDGQGNIYCINEFKKLLSCGVTNTNKMKVISPDDGEIIGYVENEDLIKVVEKL